MKGALTAFDAALDELVRQIEVIQLEWELLSAATTEPPCSEADGVAARLRNHADTGAGKRRFDYKGIIISLYGILEQYVERLLAGYCTHLTRIVPTYAELPTVLQTSHLELSFSMMGRLEQPRYRGVFTSEELVSNLHSCLSGASPFVVNVEAFTHHTANIRYEVVDMVFNRVGIAGITQRLRHFPRFRAYLEGQYQSRDIASIPAKEMFAVIDDLAERRNEVAHGNPIQLLSNAILLDYLAFVREFGHALCDAAGSASLEYAVRHSGAALGKPIAVYNNAIVCFDITTGSISRGDTLVAQTDSVHRPYLFGQIEEIQVDNVPVGSVTPPPAAKVGVKVPYKAKSAYSYFLVPSPYVP